MIYAVDRDMVTGEYMDNFGYWHETHQDLLDKDAELSELNEDDSEVLFTWS